MFSSSSTTDCDGENHDELYHKFTYEYHIPKNETLASAFVTKHNDFDGREIKIAIWDSGIDPSADGFQITTNGKKKVIGLFDSTGSGDVDTSQIIKISNESRKITTISQRQIEIPSSWIVDNNELHVGVKLLYELLPEPVVKRLSEEARNKIYDVETRRLLSQVQRENDNFLNKNKTDNKDAAGNANNPNANSSNGNNKINLLENKLMEEDIKAKEEFLQQYLDQKFPHSGPCLDVLLFQSNGIWKCGIDTSPYGGPPLEEIRLLSNYSESFDIDTFHLHDQMTYSVNIHEGGNLLEIVTTCSSHGTHVGSIAAGYFPDNPTKNGVAPGAQLVSIKIGDTRLAGMETALSICRAVKTTIELGCDIVNMSYGEPFMIGNIGEVSAAINNMILKHGIIFCCSAGNNGPALSTGGSPGGTIPEGFGIAAVVFPEMGCYAYNIAKDRLPSAMPYTWSSRGPSFDGGTGILLAAPGGALASIPQWTKAKNQLMNGTSMSSPNATGCISLILSGLKQSVPNIKRTPQLLRMALSRTCVMLPDHANQSDNSLSQGQGLIQVQTAFDWIVNTYHSTVIKPLNENHNQMIFLQNYGIKITSEGKDKGISSYTAPQLRGIYLREFSETRGIVTRIVTVSLSCFKEHFTEEQLASIEIPLIIQSRVPWVNCPQCTTLTSESVSFKVNIDCQQLEKNSLNFTHLELFHRDLLSLGPVAQLPITVIVPIRWPSLDGVPQLSMKGNIQFNQTHKLHRNFFSFPNSVTAIGLSLYEDNKNNKEEIDNEKRSCPSKTHRRLYRSHVMQLLPGDNYSSHGHTQLTQLPISEEIDYQNALFDVVYPLTIGERTLEWCFARWWQECSEMLHPNQQFTWSITAYGLNISPSELVILSGVENNSRLNIHVAIPQSFAITPTLNLLYAVQILPVQSSKIFCLSETRDKFDDEKQMFALENNYDVVVANAAEISFVCPLLNRLLYDCPIQCQMWILTDNYGKKVLTGDYKSLKTYKKRLNPGNYSLRLRLHHYNKVSLEKLQKQTMLMYAATGNLNLSATEFLIRDSQPALADAVLGASSIPGSGAVTNRNLSFGDYLQLCFAPQLSTKTINQFPQANYFEGQMTFLKDEKFKKAISLPVRIVLPHLQKSSKKDSTTDGGGDSFSKKFKTLLSKRNRNPKPKLTQTCSGDESSLTEEESYKTPSIGESNQNASVKATSTTTTTATWQEEAEISLLLAKMQMIDSLSTEEQNILLNHLIAEFGENDLLYLRSALQCAKSYEDIARIAKAILSDPDCDVISARALQKNNDFLNIVDLPTRFTKDTLTINERRDLINKARIKLGLSICKRLKELLSHDTSSEQDVKEEINTLRIDLNEIYCDICRWHDRQNFGTTNSGKESLHVKFSEFILEHARLLKYYGIFIKSAIAIQALRPSKPLEESIIEVLEEMQWNKLAEWFREEYRLKYSIVSSIMF